MITEEQKEGLIALGYTVEDVGAVWGAEWVGLHRWIDKKDDDFGVLRDSEEEAWADALRYAS